MEERQEGSCRKKDLHFYAGPSGKVMHYESHENQKIKFQILNYLKPIF